MVLKEVSILVMYGTISTFFCAEPLFPVCDESDESDAERVNITSLFAVFSTKDESKVSFHSTR